MNATDELPGVSEDDMSRQQANESTEPLVGRLGAAVLAHSKGSAYKPPCGEIALRLRVGRMGSVSVDGPGHYNLDRNEDPWGKAAIAACTVAHQRTASLDTERGTDDGSGMHKGRRQTAGRWDWASPGRSRPIDRP